MMTPFGTSTSAVTSQTRGGAVLSISRLSKTWFASDHNVSPQCLTNSLKNIKEKADIYDIRCLGYFLSKGNEEAGLEMLSFPNQTTYWNQSIPLWTINKLYLFSHWIVFLCILWILRLRAWKSHLLYPKRRCPEHRNVPQA